MANGDSVPRTEGSIEGLYPTDASAGLFDLADMILSDQRAYLRTKLEHANPETLRILLGDLALFETGTDCPPDASPTDRAAKVDEAFLKFANSNDLRTEIAHAWVPPAQSTEEPTTALQREVSTQPKQPRTRLGKRHAEKNEQEAYHKRWHERRAEVNGFSEYTLGNGMLPVNKFRVEDRITIEFAAGVDDKTPAEYKIYGDVTTVGTDSAGTYGVTIKISGYPGKCNGDGDELRGGNHIVLQGTEDPATGVVHSPGTLVTEESPIVFLGGRQLYITRAYKQEHSDDRSKMQLLRLTQVSINGVELFPKPTPESRQRWVRRLAANTIRSIEAQPNL